MIAGGSVLDTPEKRAQVVREHGERHVRTCAGCRREFYSARLASDVCHGCWYARAMEDAEVRFSPLAEELERRLEVKTSVDQTGGMTMCLRVPIGAADGNRETRKWAWFSELSAGGDEVHMGLYEVDDDDEYVDELGESHEFPNEGGLSWPCRGGECEWYHHPVLAEAVAEWAAPIIVEFATRNKEETP